MKTKIMLPALAFVFAIGMSFATERSTADPVNDWVDVGLAEPVMIQEVNCGVGEDVFCTGQINGNGPELQVYDDENLTIPKRTSDDGVKHLIPILE